MSFFYNGTVIGSVLGTVIPFIIGISYYICKFIIKVKNEGLKNVTLEEWKEFGKQIENEIEELLGESSKLSKTTQVDSNCEHCQGNLQKINSQVSDLNKKIRNVQEKLVDHVESKVKLNQEGQVNKSTNKLLTK